MSEARAGFISGNIILLKILKEFAPSIFAASKSAVGSPSMNCFNKITPKDDPSPGRISDAYVFRSPICRNRRYMGIIRLCTGIIMPAITIQNQIFLPGKSNLENA